MKALLTFALLLVLATGFAQIPTKKTLVLDETWVVASGEKRFRVITSNDSISHWFMQKFEGNALKKYGADWIEDKRSGGFYWQRSFYFLNEDWNTIVAFVDWIEKNKRIRKR